jgi:hypothetical protein
VCDVVQVPNQDDIERFMHLADPHLVLPPLLGGGLSRRGRPKTARIKSGREEGMSTTRRGSKKIKPPVEDKGRDWKQRQEKEEKTQVCLVFFALLVFMCVHRFAKFKASAKFRRLMMSDV